MRCHLSDDVEAFLTQAGPFLHSRPVEHNLLATLAALRRNHPEPSRYLWVTDGVGGEVVGAAVQTPVTFRAAVTPMSPDAVDVLVERLAAEAPDLPGVVSDAATAAAFAGRWTTTLGVPGQPLEAQRLYQLGRLTLPEGVPGRLRAASRSEIDLLVDWWTGFDEETDLERPAFDDRAAIMEARVDNDLVWLWDVDGAPTSMAITTIRAADTVRIGLVYTPPSQRGRSYAAACVGELSRHVLATGARHCCLYTQLSNPTSNRVYQRLGYTPVAEILLYAFG